MEVPAFEASIPKPASLPAPVSCSQVPHDDCVSFSSEVVVQIYEPALNYSRTRLQGLGMLLIRYPWSVICRDQRMALGGQRWCDMLHDL